MMPDPLHPAIVHLPIALAILIPGLAAAGVVLIHLGYTPARNWVLIIGLQALLVGSAWFAVETGEDQEERVERVVAEHYIETHEEAAERLLLFAWLGLAVTATGLLPGWAGTASRVAGLVATLVILGLSVPVGRSGGELVYKHGAANAYVDPAVIARGAEHSDEDSDDD